MTFFQRIKTPFTEAPADEEVRYQPRMRLVGELLQERREHLGLDLDEIGAMLRIKPTYLAALEQGRTHDLPGPTYAIGFVRAYAEFLGLEAGPVLERFKAEAAGVTARPDLALPVPLGERSVPGGALVLIALIVALCGYGIWYYLSTEDRSRPERVAAVPAALKPPAATPSLVAPPQSTSPPATGQAVPQGSAQSSLFGAAENPGQTPPVSARTSPPAVALAPAAAPPPAMASGTARSGSAGTPLTTTGNLTPGALLTPMSGTDETPSAVPGAAQPAPAAASPTAPQMAAAPAASAPTAAAGPGHVAIRATADCWIQVRTTDGAIVFARVLKAGEIYNVPQRAGLSLRTGNAGVLDITVDGKAVPPIGGIGTLRRDVALDPGELAAGTAVHG